MERPQSELTDETFGDVHRDCERCKTLEQSISRFRGDVESLQHQNVANLREIGRLRRELAEHLEEEPEAPDVRELLLLWRDEVMGGEKKLSVRLDGPRAQRVKWALKRYKKERLRHAILGTRRDDWAMGRDARTRSRRYNDIAKHILKDEETIERFERLYHGGATHSRQAAKPRVSGSGVGRLLKVAEGVKEEAGRWKARCPVHDDRVASLYIAQGKKGAVVTCNAGCDPRRIAEAWGIPLAEWFDGPDAEPPVALPSPPESLPSDEQLDAWHARLLNTPKMVERLKVVKGWTLSTLKEFRVGWDGERLVLPVMDASGVLLTVVRYLPNGRPKTLGLRGRTRGLFPPPETLTGDIVWLLEGEPDALSAHTAGVPGVAVPGVNGWRVEWTTRFSGRRVRVCFDCDAPGREAAERVAASLLVAAKDVSVVDLAPDRSDGFDLSDFVLGGGSVDDLLRLALGSGSVVQLRRDAA